MSNKLSRKSGNYTITYNVKKDLWMERTRNLVDIVEPINVENLEVGCITTEYSSFITRSPCGRVSITGNTHNKEKFRGRQIHVGVDAWDYSPVSIKQIERYIYQYESKKGEK